ncbi:hypothetical protein BHE74_00004141 [Ensete ventricosum]|nr:hypothetical protein BHE74_00004141 [Ensete ventricosum]RZR81652.1 hypothetical protein BHM03_00007914 [Ensete ventricosum]
MACIIPANVWICWVRLRNASIETTGGPGVRCWRSESRVVKQSPVVIRCGRRHVWLLRGEAGGLSGRLQARPSSSRVRKLARVGRNWDLRLGLGPSLRSQRPGISSVICSPALLRVRTVDPAQRSRRGLGGCPTRPLRRPSQLVSRKREASCLSFWRVEREPPLVLSKGDFILTGGEVARTFGLTSTVTLGMAESYGEPVGAMVWGEDMVRYAAFLARGGGVGMAQRPNPSTSTADVDADLAAKLEQTQLHLRR